MHTPRFTSKRTTFVAAGVGLATSALLAVPAAGASTHHATSGDHQALAKTAASLVSKLGSRSAGSYIEGGKLVTTVTNDAAANTARAAGATPKRVSRGMAQLHKATAQLSHSAKVPGTAWSISPQRDQVVVKTDRTVDGAKLSKVEKAAKRLGAAVTVRRVSGKFSPKIAGGDAIYGGEYRCSLGFVAHNGGTPYFITAGHCGNVASDWYSDQAESQHVGSTVSSTFPGHDYALVKLDSDQASAVDLYNGSTQAISGAGDATVGENVTRSGSTSHVHSGTVTGLNATVNYQEGTVNGLIDTNVCAEAGDSGGPLFDGSSAIGITSGGSGDCTSGGETFFQPAKDAASALGVTIG